MRKKFLVMGRRRLFYTVALVFGVVVPLMLAAYYVPVQGVAGLAGGMLTYSSPREKISFDYPYAWLLRTERDYSGGEILETASFASPDSSVRGFVQVMQLAQPIPEYIRQSEKNMAPGYDSLLFRQIEEGGRQGYLLSYKRGTGNARAAAREYFFEKGGKVYRFSYFYLETQEEQVTKLVTPMMDSFRF